MTLTFNEAVAEWLRSEGDAVERVESVRAYGTDWAWDTEHGFYSESDVEITYVGTNGVWKRRTVRGEDMQSLWEYLMKSWPERVEP